MSKVHITKLSDTEFHFEYEDKEQVKGIQSLKEFEHEGQYYKVLRIIPTFDLSGYHAFMVYVRPKSKFSTLLGRTRHTRARDSGN